ncbi:MAG: serine hydrolase [Bacteroidetes bacterium]|nr:serine hydrolase [Bacteroidota bacterium]
MSNAADPYTSVIDLLHDEYTAYPPDYLFAYSNLGYSLLGCLVERVTGIGFVEYTDSALFAPMGMNCSSYAENRCIRQWYSKGYIRNRGHP